MRQVVWGLVALLLAALAATASGGPVLAQQEPRGGAGGLEQRGAPAGSFDYYVLALSWSAGFCQIEGDRDNRDQCRTGAGHGFVVHGLWPQFSRGWPAFCVPEGRGGVPRTALEKANAVFVSEGLARHQWRKHGTCSGLSPSGYFDAVAEARAKVTIPAGFEGRGEIRLEPNAVERAFAAANQGLNPRMMSVTCERGILEEVRICLSRDLRSFVECPAVDNFRCRTAEVVVPPAR